MIDVIPASTEPLNTWLVDSSGNFAASGAGLALLEAEITHFHTARSEEANSPNESASEA
jgi:hypothetical protein